MAFQFTCPQGHLLEGDESQAGQRCNCPECGTLFLIPTPVDAPPDEPPVEMYAPSAPPEEERLLHIPCPSGHVLETPLDMLGQEVICPQCGAQFGLREKDSLEARERRRQIEEAQERHSAQTWFNWAVVLGVLVIISLVGLVVYVMG